MSINLQGFMGLANIELHDFQPKPTSVEGNQVEAHQAFWSTPDGNMEVGIWECTAGRFVTERLDSSEVCHFISGRLELTDADGTVTAFGPGDVVVLPKGWKGEWKLLDRVRKLYFIISE